MDWAKFCREDFRNYADVCFREFGDRVKHWITFNEPWSYSSGGYASGTLAPGRCSPWEEGKCTTGDSGREPYIVSHHQLLAHAEAVKLYEHKYQVRIHELYIYSCLVIASQNKARSMFYD